MWTSYSKSGGVVVRIKYADFKAALVEYFKSRINGNHGIQLATSGLINYVDQDAEFQQWTDMIKSGIPLAFFKQHHFKQECEYRILLERDVFKEPGDFNKTHSIFKHLENYDIILHPSSWQDEFLELKQRIQAEKQVRVSFSKLRFSK